MFCRRVSLTVERLSVGGGRKSIISGSFADDASHEHKQTFSSATLEMTKQSLIGIAADLFLVSEKYLRGNLQAEIIDGRGLVRKHVIAAFFSLRRDG